VVLLDEMLNRMFCKTQGSAPAPAGLEQAVKQVRAQAVVQAYQDDDGDFEEPQAPRGKGARRG
jgi:hypothetical protein